MKEQLSESKVLAVRLWKSLLSAVSTPPSNAELTYKHGLLAIFLYASRNSLTLNEQIAQRIFARDARGRHFSSDDPLRTPLYEWLVQGDSETYVERLQGAYVATLEWLGRPIDLAPAFNRINHSWLEVQSKTLDSWLQLADEQQFLFAFDDGLARLVAMEVDVPRETFLAELAANFLPKKLRRIGDLTGATGRFPVAEYVRTNVAFDCLLGNSKTVPEAVDMRLTMMNLKVLHSDFNISDASVDSLWPLSIDMLLVNPTPRQIPRKSAKNVVMNAPDSLKSALAWTDKLLRTASPFEFALVVVPRADATAGGWRAEFREHLVKAGRIAAVIDLPKFGPTSSNANFSAWLLRGNNSNFNSPRNDILFVDAEPLTRLTLGTRISDVAHFIGTLLTARVGDVAAANQSLQQLDESAPELAEIFSREFTPENFESPGLSRTVPLEDVRRAGFALTAKTYIHTAIGRKWEHGLDKRQLDDILNRDDSFGKRMYVIGNNGEGKSLLLRDTAAEFRKTGRLTIAIASGLSDRFLLSKKGGEESFYRYRGARTTASTINYAQTATYAAKLMMMIYFDDNRLRVFEEILQLIGFTKDLFLIPKDATRSTVTGEKELFGIARLSNKSDEDNGILFHLYHHPDEYKKYKLGVRRVRDEDSIVPFDQLSSGEQQILLLTAKMVAEAEARCLILIDEPEISLHVSWQRALPRILKIIAMSFDIDILVATHSPIIISSTESDGDFCFTIKKRTVVPLQSENTRSVETALFEGFKTHTPNNREVHERCAALVAEFIDKANQPNSNVRAEKDVLKSLNEMKSIVEEQQQLAPTNSIQFDIQLIERAKAAILEIAAVSRGDME